MRKGRHLTKEETKNIIKLLKEKKNAADVSTIVKRSQTGVRNVAKKNGLVIFPRKIGQL